MKVVIKESRLDYIIQYVKEVFFIKGYLMIVILDVCKLVGCSRMMFYFYFEFKENLYLVVVKKILSCFFNYFVVLELEGKMGMERVLILVEGYFVYVKVVLQYYQVMFDFYGILRSINEIVV